MQTIGRRGQRKVARAVQERRRKGAGNGNDCGIRTQDVLVGAEAALLLMRSDARGKDTVGRKYRRLRVHSAPSYAYTYAYVRPT